MIIQISLDLANFNNAQILIEVDHIISNMTGNARFAAADIVAQVAVVKISSVNLRTIVSGPTTDTKTSDIKIARDILNRSLKKLANKVQDLANDPSIIDNNREMIVNSAGMTIKSQGRPQKRQFTVKNSDISGTVVLTAEGGVNAHEWQYTRDIVNYKERIALSSTTIARTEIQNLIKGTEYAFFHKAIKRGTSTDWEDAKLLVVT